jgi:Kef-type K+ transport system membrane component KefB
VAALATTLVCVLVGSAVGALCNAPLLRHPGASLLSTLAVVVLALVSGVSPAAAALKYTAPVTDGAALALPHWPGVVPLVAAAGLLAVTWTASVLVATRRDNRGASPS